MVRNNPSQHLVMDTDQPKPKDQGPDVAMANAAGDSTPHGGQGQDSHPDQGLQLNPEAPGPGNQDGQQPQEPANNNAMQGNVPPKVIERQE